MIDNVAKEQKELIGWIRYSNGLRASGAGRFLFRCQAAVDKDGDSAILPAQGDIHFSMGVDPNNKQQHLYGGSAGDDGMGAIARFLTRWYCHWEAGVWWTNAMPWNCAACGFPRP